MVNSVIARINNRDYEIKKGSINYSIDAVGTFSVEVLASELVDWRNMRNTDDFWFS
jgi:hypothetical protein